MKSRILDALRDSGALTVAELASRLSIKNPRASKELTGLKHQGKVMQMGRGIWTLTQEEAEPQETA
jgi:Mn-dependent DtxR family transcriptional regulator